MKLLRVGDKGKEKPAIMDKDGKIRDISSHIKDLNPDFLKQNIRCNSIAPGTVFSPSWQDRVNQSPDPVQAKKDFIARQPMGRLGTAEEIASMAIYLAGDESTFTTGNTFSVDGGMTI